MAETEVPQVFTDFNKNQPCKKEVIVPSEDYFKDKSPEEIAQARELLVEQLYGPQAVSKDAISQQIISKTSWVVLLRHLPEVEGKKDANQYIWFAGHYEWDELVHKVLEAEKFKKTDAPLAIYLVPTIGQSDQLSIRHELTYNAFISPSGLVPFNHLVQRHFTPRNQEEDQELYSKGDPCSFPTLDSLHLGWERLMQFTSEHFDFLDAEQSIDVFILKPHRSFQASFKKFYMENPEKMEEWYDVAVLNFLPLIPYPTKDGKYTRFPLVMIDPIEVTPPSYTELINLCLKINEQFYIVKDDERVGNIRNIIKYWQFDSNSIVDELVIFANNGNSIPAASPEFNSLFFDQLKNAKYFIIDEIFDRYLHIKRASDDYEMLKDAPKEVDEELEKYDTTIKMRLLHENKAIKDEYAPIFAELKRKIIFWFDKGNLATIYNEFKAAITTAMTAIINTIPVHN